MECKNLLITGGKVIDPAGHFRGPQNLRIREGRLAEISPNLEPQEDEKVISLQGEWVVPGLIDIHVHSYPEKTNLGIAPDRIGLSQGVCLIADAGSAGSDTFRDFYRDIIAPAHTRVISWINISRPGLCQGNAELADLSNLDPEGVVRLAQEFPDVICGVKVRMSSSVLGENGITPLVIAKEAGRKSNLPLMVHIGNGPPFLEEILPLLTRGDVVTHGFHGKKGGLVDGSPELFKLYKEALARGVYLDIGHGEASFSFQALEKALSAGIFPSSISTDIHVRNIDGPVYSMIKTMDKMRAAGFSLEEVVSLSTLKPAQIIGLDDSYGTLTIGNPARITILQELERSQVLVDSEGESRELSTQLEAVWVIHEGKVWDLQC